MKGSENFLTMETVDCTGCNACLNACPADAITMISDQEGFWYPRIDYKKCLKCGACDKACPSLTPGVELKEAEPAVYAAWTKDEKLRITSTSGGVFSELAKLVLQTGGMAFGARYREDFSIEHHGVSVIGELEQLKQSKYAQSDIGTVFREIKRELGRGRQVLFCGTPCQSAGLQCFLGKEEENLLICDFICRGVNSPGVYARYLESLQVDYGAKIKTIQFKNKDIGWNQFCTKVVFEDGQIHLKDKVADDFMRGYLFFNLYLRPSCYECKYKKIPRVSDISLADFWGIGATHPHLDQNKGTSLILLNSAKGRAFFQKVRSAIKCEECSLEDAKKGNKSIFNSSKMPVDRDLFFNRLDMLGSFSEVMRCYQKETSGKGILLRMVSLFRRIAGVR